MLNYRNNNKRGIGRQSRGAGKGQPREGGGGRDSAGQRALPRAAGGGDGVGCSPPPNQHHSTNFYHNYRQIKMNPNLNNLMMFYSISASAAQR